MQALALDVKVLSEDNKEIEMKDSSEYDDDIPNVEEIMDVETRRESDEEIFNAGFTEETDPDEETAMLGGEVEIDE
jgi:DNA-directed RNA polymerase subunit beta